MLQKSEVIIRIAFILLNTNVKANFSYHIQLSRKIYVKSLKSIIYIYRYISIANTLCLMKFFNIFYAHKVDRTVEFDIIRISEAITLHFLKTIA